MKDPCICIEGDPCDYHAATCVSCPGGCNGHPSIDPTLYYRATHRARRGAPPYDKVKPRAEALEGRRMVVRASFRIDKDEYDGGMYGGERAMQLPYSVSKEVDILWVAQGDLVDWEVASDEDEDVIQAFRRE